MPIPEFRNDGWLPEGHHRATWEEIETVFGGETGSRRNRIIQQLLIWRNKLREKGITGLLVLNGSFVSSKKEPGDFDAIFAYDEEAATIIANDRQAFLLLDYTTCRNSMGCDLLAFPRITIGTHLFAGSLDAYDKEKVTGTYKGVLEVTI